MCAHQAYMGVAIANRYTSVEVNNKRHKIERPLEEHITLPEGTIPAIVTPELFAAVQEKLTRNKIEAARNNRDPETFLLRAGFILCGYCGKKVHTAHHKKRDGSLRPAYAVMTNSAEHEACPAFSMSAPILDAVVWERVKELMQEGAIERELARLEEQPDTTALEEQAVQRMRETNTKQITNLSRALAMLDDAEAQTPILVQIRDLTERNHALQEELEAIASRWFSAQAAKRSLDDIKRRIIHASEIEGWSEPLSYRPMIQDTGNALDNLSYSQKRDLLAALGIRVTLYRADHTPRYVIETNIPVGEGDIVTAPDSPQSRPPGLRR